ncbi:MAG: diaminopimelate decarboxylase [Acidocella sp.]|nr:diaminopimelate decarboxylase [Acidocella sp.]
MTNTGDAASLADLMAARHAFKMHAQDGLCFEDVPLHAIADAHGTPTWVYGAGSMAAQYSALMAAFRAANVSAHVHYAVKANDHLAVLDIFRQLGAGADVVSGGELARARHAGIAAADIVFSGVGKSATEIGTALAEGVGQINVESAEELVMISGIASAMGTVAPVALRMNPDVDAGTHEKITTGVAGNKFGLAQADIPGLYARARLLPGVRPVGIALHIGSQILSTAPYRAAYAKATAMVIALRAAGESVAVLDLGGGLGIGYGDEPGLSLSAFAQTINHATSGLGVKLLVEPGRYLVGAAGLLLASVILQKHDQGKRFVVLDAAMNDLIRPALYEAWHGIMPLSPVDYRAGLSPADVVGPVCESADRFAADRLLPALVPGARVAILDAGAYGAVMSSHYNARPRGAAIMISGGRFHLITPRQDIAALWADEQRLPG